ncbi:MAG: preprotein translocase subunit YajC [Oscillospiraceae bacterium]|nr:preprotein translocase subunit YajC [Oscillospiraceae bacterium]
MNLFMLMSEGATTADAAGGLTVSSILSLIIPFVLVILIFYFLIIRPEKKRNKEMQEMLNNIQVADEVITTGGIIGRVLSVKEDTVLIETGSDRTKIRVMKTAIAKNNTAHESVEETAEAKPAKNKNGKTEIK